MSPIGFRAPPWEHRCMRETRHASDRVSGWVRPRTQDPLSHLRFRRSRDDAWVSGVAGGLGQRWGVEPVIVWVSFVVLSWAGAVGVVAYLIAWSVSLDTGDRRAPASREPNATQAVAFGAIVLGATLLLRTAGLWLGDAVGVPLMI